ncbi:hypothetical protein [Henriciella marina]|uniref:hypothetical protein n=1 Tax=Henriciella marina TaxID=453851 RepID=UPI00036E4BBA|nr:hypothetical protein [Henriciella marina]
MTEAGRISFDPLLGWPLMWALLALCVLAYAAYLYWRGRAWLMRAAVLTVLAAALANPAYVREERDPLPSVAAIIVDRSESMSFGERKAIADAALEKLRADMDADTSLEVRLIETNSSADGTNLIAALEGLMADVPRDRIAGAVLVTDGQVHDVPEDLSRLEALGPIHSLITGDPESGDRRISLVRAPDFGIVGEEAAFVVRVDDPVSPQATVTYSMNGGETRQITVQTGTDTPLPIEIERRGDNIVVVETPAGEQELTLANNRTASTLSGVRDRLRVLLITGKPNAAGRVWRDLLKSDPSVDLVHFTILRPPYKQDVTPLEEMALIAFPTDELFEDKLKEFDLIIFDQYERRTVITMSYLANMARYVAEGGALLIAAGEDFAGPASLANTPLAGVLPALPTGTIKVGKFTPQLSETGRRHTITQSLPDQSWGDWVRYIEAVPEVGDVLMTAQNDDPLLVVDRVGDGRVAQILSGQIWLWARGYDGGGPFAELIRRTVHWLMKEPELEERQLLLEAQGDTMRARLRTLSDTAPTLSVETPDGETLNPRWTETGPGEFTAELPIDQLGLFRATSGGLEAVALNGPANPKEYASLEATGDVLRPVSEATGGGIYDLTRPGAALPDLRRVSASANAAGAGWFGLRERGAYAVRSSTSVPLLPGLLAVILILAFLILAWRREGQ